MFRTPVVLNFAVNLNLVIDDDRECKGNFVFINDVAVMSLDSLDKLDKFDIFRPNWVVM